MCENIARILKLDNPPCNRAPDFEDKHDDEEFVIREESKSDVPPDDLQTVTLSSDLSVNYPASRYVHIPGLSNHPKVAGLKLTAQFRLNQIINVHYIR
jgi:hypothetical protein